LDEVKGACEKLKEQTNAKEEHIRKMLQEMADLYLLVMGNFNTGYVALSFVVVVFFSLQFWWISLTIRNGRNERVLVKQDQTEQIKNRLEKVLLHTARK